MITMDVSIMMITDNFDGDYINDDNWEDLKDTKNNATVLLVCTRMTMTLTTIANHHIGVKQYNIVKVRWLCFSKLRVFLTLQASSLLAKHIRSRQGKGGRGALDPSPRLSLCMERSTWDLAWMLIGLRNFI